MSGLSGDVMVPPLPPAQPYTQLSMPHCNPLIICWMFIKAKPVKRTVLRSALPVFFVSSKKATSGALQTMSPPLYGMTPVGSRRSPA